MIKLSIVPAGISQLAAIVLLAIPAAVLAQSITLPIHQQAMPDGQIRYSTPISIAHGPTIEAMIDTGSVGLRVLAAADPGAMSNPASTNPPTESRYGYGSGVSLNGADIQDDVTVGRTSHIAFQLVKEVGCLPRHPQCPASRLDPADYRIGGNGAPRAGYMAILGIGAPHGNGARLENPLRALGYSNWTVELPRPGDVEPGRLTLYASPVTLADITPLTSDAFGRVQGCLTKSGDAQPVCALMAFDTGAPGVVIHSPDIDTPSSWPVGTTATLGFANTALPKIEFVSGPPGAVTYVGWRPPEGRSIEVIASGTLVYFYYVFLYDSNGRVVGAGPRSTG
ncbi:hypothetical protein [Burkholderia sp. L27(2015)]|uniref:hypothetical protein n=1 Tax=Burkholderia sp. L27(2015) TaxID=1641858 RepID=UPI00131AFF46|nr:hypothetical protein [Burkholderia sp. L27(2015)]